MPREISELPHENRGCSLIVKGIESFLRDGPNSKSSTSTLLHLPQSTTQIKTFKDSITSDSRTRLRRLHSISSSKPPGANVSGLRRGGYRQTSYKLKMTASAVRQHHETSKFVASTSPADTDSKMADDIWTPRCDGSVAIPERRSMLRLFQAFSSSTGLLTSPLSG